MPFHYSTELRRRVCQRLLAGDPIKSMAIELSISQVTLFRWKKQGLIDLDRKPGVKSFEVDELARACRTIQELEDELALVKATSALFNGEEPVCPKGGTRLPKH